MLTLCDPVDCGLPGFSIRGILQARILGRMGQHWSPYPSRVPYFLLPWPPTPRVSGAARTPAPKQLHHLPRLAPPRGRPKSSRAASGANPSGRPHAEVEIKAQLKPRGSVTKEEDPKPSHQLHKLQIKSTQSTRQTLCLWNTQKATESSLKREHTSADSCGHRRQEHTGVGPDGNLSGPHSRSRDQHSVGGHPREGRWTVTPGRERTLTAETQEKHLLFLCFDLLCRFFWMFFSFFFLFLPHSVVVVNFIGTMKPN